MHTIKATVSYNIMIHDIVARLGYEKGINPKIMFKVPIINMIDTAAIISLRRVASHSNQRGKPNNGMQENNAIRHTDNANIQ